MKKEQDPMALLSPYLQRPAYSTEYLNNMLPWDVSHIGMQASKAPAPPKKGSGYITQNYYLKFTANQLMRLKHHYFSQMQIL